MKKKIVALALVFCLALAVGVGGTLAYLTATTETVTNTFTVGNVKFDGTGLDEADVDQYGKLEYKDDGTTLKDRVTENTYKLVPGHKYTKDPTVHIAANNEDCWVFVKVVNPIANIEAEDPETGDGTTIAAQMKKNGWVAVSGAENVYTRAKVGSSASKQDFVVFSSFTLKDDASFAANGYSPITVQAALVQADGFDTAAAAWTEVGSSLFTTTSGGSGETDPAPTPDSNE